MSKGRNPAMKSFPGRFFFEMSTDKRASLKISMVTDFTYMIPKDFDRKLTKKLERKLGQECSWSTQAEIRFEPDLIPGQKRLKLSAKQKCGLRAISLTARVLFCRARTSGGQEAYSVTARADKDSGSAASEELRQWVRDHHGKNPSLFESATTFTTLGDRAFRGKPTAKDTKAWFARSQYKAPAKIPEGNLISIRRTVEQLHSEVFFHGGSPDGAPEPDHMHGTVLIAGRTKSAKSLITRGLIHQFLSHPQTFKSLVDLHSRRPHLVTCEDPIEATFFPKPSKPDDEKEIVGIDYSPRDRTQADYSKLTDAFTDALRQTPSCLFVGEVRDSNDLKATLKFGGTGHLAIATMHAGSLADVFSQVFSAWKAGTAADRGNVCQRVLAVIHLSYVSTADVVDDSKSWSAVLPSLWRRSPASTAGIVASDIGSLTPQFSGPDECQFRANQGIQYDCLGRQYFAGQLLSPNESEFTSSASDAWKSLSEDERINKLRKLRESFLNKARQLDIQGQ